MSFNFVLSKLYKEQTMLSICQNDNLKGGEKNNFLKMRIPYSK